MQTISEEKERQLRAMFGEDRFIIACGVKIEEIGQGYARAAMDVREDMLNGAQVANGGALFTLADLAFAVAANSMSENISLTLSMQMNFLKSAKLGDHLVAQAQCLSGGGKMGSYDVTVRNQEGIMLASAQGMSYQLHRKV